MKKIILVILIVIAGLIAFYVMNNKNETPYEIIDISNISYLTQEEVIENYNFETDFDHPLLYLVIDDEGNLELRKYIISEGKNSLKMNIPHQSSMAFSLHENRTIAGYWSILTNQSYTSFDSKSTLSPSDELAYGEDDHRQNYIFNKVIDDFSVEYTYQLTSKKPIYDIYIQIHVE